MIISYSWLKEFVDIPYSPEELADKLTLLGLEVASITPLGQGLTNVVVAQVIEVNPHPQADKLQVCSLVAGDNKYTVVCGAPNVAVGQRVPLAVQGCTLPGGMKIKRAKIRGCRVAGYDLFSEGVGDR